MVQARVLPLGKHENGDKSGAGGGGRTHMTSEGRGILSPVRLPVPPLQRGNGERFSIYQPRPFKSSGTASRSVSMKVARFHGLRRASEVICRHRQNDWRIRAPQARRRKSALCWALPFAHRENAVVLRPLHSPVL